jgi:phosphate uptake regulator
MRTLVVALSLLVASPARSQAPAPPEASPTACAIALPHGPNELVQCTPEFAAAYDLAFCSLHYSMTALAAPREDHSKQTEARVKELDRKALAFSRVSEMLTDGDRFRENVDAAQKYFESLKGRAADVALERVQARCEDIESHHAAVLNEFIRRVKPPAPAAGR